MSNSLPEPYGVLFEFAPEHDEGAAPEAPAAIRILEPEFKNVVIRYSTVRFEEHEKQQEATLHFNYDILSGEVSSDKTLDFELTLGNLLYDIMLLSAEA